MNKRQWEKKIDIDSLIVVLYVTVAVFLLALDEEAILKEAFSDLLYFFNQDAETVMGNMRNHADFIGGAVWTMTTILASFLSFYYSSVKYRNYGIANRKIMAYTYGTLFLPILVLINCIMVLFMTISYYAQLYVDFYIYAMFSCVFQASVMVICINATAQENSAKTIVKIEKIQYEYLCSHLFYDEVDNGNQTSEVTNLIVSHVESILGSDESWNEKSALIQEILLIPVKEEIKKESYYYLYSNIKKVALYANENPKMAYQVYNLFYENFQTLVGMQGVDRRLVYLDAVFIAFIPQSNLDQRWAFFANLIKMERENTSHKSRIILELLTCMVYSYYMMRLQLKKKVERQLVEECFASLKQYWNEDLIQADLKLEENISTWMMDANTEKEKQFKQIYAIKKSLRCGDNRFINYLLKYVLGGN